MKPVDRITALAAFLLIAAEPAQVASEAPYMPPDAVPDAVTILPAAPADDSATAAADRAIFLQTRKLQGTPRWRIAIDDVQNTPLDRYACAIGMVLTPERAPVTARLLDKAGIGALVDPVKSYYHRRRPWVGSDQSICEAKTAHLAANGDYPSGHAANGWLEALILAELLPHQATAILARGRQYGESRVVCGSHSASAVSAGWLAGSAAYAALHGSAAFRADLARARRELGAIQPHAHHPDAAACQALTATLAIAPW